MTSSRRRGATTSRWCRAPPRRAPASLRRSVVSRLSSRVSLLLPPEDGDDVALGARNDVRLGGMNHKMGQTASVNAGELPLPCTRLRRTVTLVVAWRRGDLLTTR